MDNKHIWNFLSDIIQIFIIIIGAIATAIIIVTIIDNSDLSVQSMNPVNIFLTKKLMHKLTT
jgi:hypothetical protein